MTPMEVKLDSSVFKIGQKMAFDVKKKYFFKSTYKKNTNFEEYKVTQMFFQEHVLRFWKYLFSKLKWLPLTCFESYNRSLTLLCFLIKSLSSLGHVLVQTKLFFNRFSSWKRQMEPGKLWSRREIEPRLSFVLSAVNWKWIHFSKNSCKQPSESLVLIFLEQFVL